jgi:arsenate reductase
MAEGFARRYGADVLDAASAGLSPLSYVAPLTIETMKQHGIDISDQYPKTIDEAPFRPWDIVVNMSGLPLPFPLPGQLLTWPVRDPFTLPPSVYQQVARDIESRVQALLLTLRRQPPP